MGSIATYVYVCVDVDVDAIIMSHIMYAAAIFPYYCLMSLNLNLSWSPANASWLFLFWYFMQFLGVNMLIRICITRCRTKNVFEMLIKRQTLVAFIHIYGN